MEIKIIHPVSVKTKTNIGTIRHFKYIRFEVGNGKYKYWIEESNATFMQEEITKFL